MRIIAIGDIHAKTVWKEIVKKEYDADKIIFIGDYFDTFDNVSTDEQIKNFEEILSLKREEPEKYIILMGNHDFHYYSLTIEEYSGYQRFGAESIMPVVGKAIADKLIQICYQFDKYLFSHAGVTNSWLNMVAHLQEINVETINNLPVNAFRFFRGDSSGYGQNPFQSPIWVRPESLTSDAVKGVFQIVGHTKVPHIKYNQNLDTEPLVLIDCLDSVNEYLEIKNGNFKTKTL